jgi:hypothetical protein
MFGHQMAEPVAANSAQGYFLENNWRGNASDHPHRRTHSEAMQTFDVGKRRRRLIEPGPIS